MTSRITEMEPPNRFVDEQVKGLFRRFRHVHEFRQDAAGTIMVDRIEFEAPFGVVGRLVEKLVLSFTMTPGCAGPAASPQHPSVP